MRIIGGEFRSRRLLTPPDASTTRPIPDRVKESLFGLLRGHVEEATVFDAFAGTGAIGLEAVSRGAARCIMVERDRKVAEILRQNVEALGAHDRCEVVIGDALGPGALARCPRPVTLVFMDPPYALVRDPAGWNRVKAQAQRLVDFLSDDGFLIIRTPWPFFLEPEPLPEAPAPRERMRRGPRHPHPHDHHPPEHAMPHRRGTPSPTPSGDEDEPAETPDEGESPAQQPRLRAALSLSNAEGPETHAYNTTAIHLYACRSRRDDSPATSH